MRASAILLAAGEGSRCAGELPKQFRPLGGRPVLEWACAPFRGCEHVAEIIVVVSSAVLSDPPAWLTGCADRLVEGGSSRRESAGRGVREADPGSDVILIHDAARPFASLELIERVAWAALGGPVVPVLPVADTIKRVSDDGVIEGTQPRGELRRTQTPQGFPGAMIRRLHSDAEDRGLAAPDDAYLCELAGELVASVPGEELNLKLTTEADFEYAEWVASRFSPEGANDSV
ncbi:MAG: IspD/TarI family cytidylyltransferase [Gemmatimonadota bacterium]